MPGMSGRELAHKIRSARPEVRILLMSGYTEEAVHSHGSPLAGVEFMEKPFTGQELSTRVREILDEPGASEIRIAAGVA